MTHRCSFSCFLVGSTRLIMIENERLIRVLPLISKRVVELTVILYYKIILDILKKHFVLLCQYSPKNRNDSST